MNCPTCQTSLPDDARFCGACGLRFHDAAAAASSLTSPGPPASTSSTSTPSSSTPAMAKTTTPPSSSFALTAQDFSRAFQKACERSGVVPPADVAPTDHASLRAAVEAAGVDPLDMEKALHRISVEKLPEDKRRAMGVVLDDEVVVRPRSPLIPVIIGLNVVAVAIGVAAFVFRAPPPMPIVMAPQQGQIDMAALSARVDVLTKAAESCFQVAVEKTPTLSGDVTLAVRVSLDGTLESATVAKATLNDDTATACMIAKANEGVWPKAKIAPVDVDIPLSFTVVRR